MAQTLEAVFQQGSNTIRFDHTPGSSVANGQVVNLGNGLVGVCTSTEGIGASKLGSLAGNGIFRLLKADDGAVNFAVGDQVAWDDSGNLAVAPADGDFNTGLCIQAAGNTDDGVWVLLNVTRVSGNVAGLTLTALAGTANTTLEALPDPADAPGTADILREDIVDNLLPPLRNNLADVGTQLNAVIAALKAAGLMAAD